MPVGKNRGVPSRRQLSDELILAAVERAELHSRNPKTRGVLYASVVGHLGYQMGSATGRWFRPRFRALEAARLIRGVKRHGMILWTLTPKGHRQLDAARRAVSLDSLPESPQHRIWRETRAGAGEGIGEFREALCSLLDEAASLLADEDTPSEPWFVLGKGLERACWRIGSATHCLREWAEPDDASADVDDGPRRGRRNRASWR